MIAFHNVSKQHGPQVLFTGASFQFDPGEKVGLVGANGSGKSTVFRLIMGEEQVDEGSIEKPRRLTVGVFRQDVGDWRDGTVLEVTCGGAGPVAEYGRELAELEVRLEDWEAADYDQVLERYGEVQEQFFALGGYDLEPRASKILAGLGLTQDRIEGPIAALSGGWKMRVALARILLQAPDVMLLDEPTNHLDIESILWLEAFLRDYSGTVVMTCHDRDVMNRVVKRILEIDAGEIRSWTGDYDNYEKMRAEASANLEAEFNKQQAMLAKEIRFIERFKAQPSKASQVQSRARKLDKIERVVPPRRIVERSFNFQACARSGDEVIKVSGVSKGFGDTVVHDNLDLLVRRGERWAIMGENGAGKTTLLNMMAGRTKPDAGTVRLGAAVELGWFAQHHADNLDDGRTVIEELLATYPSAGLGTLKTLAGAFSFSGDDVDKRISVLSGGEKTRLALAKLLYAAPNLLVLDEPTNHLDLITKRALLRALDAYEGTLVFVSHDREFLRALSNHVLELSTTEPPRLYPGTYAEYVQQAGHEAPGLRA
ncbi:MAG: ATPase subunit of ABC transporter with duplicated ATPase domains [Myxococcota bacterium]|jgi:ATPase subunit of ABC transporter with duplicated ATPase domains